jgi:hypothetical protein
MLKLCTAADFVKNAFFSNFEVSYLCNKTSDRQNKIFLRNAIPFSFFHILLLFEFKLRFQAKNAMLLQHPEPILALILCGWGEGREGGLVKDSQGLKRSLQSHVGSGGQYKMYKNLIFIILISRSKKVKPKMLTCV